MAQERYTIPEALQALGISKSALDSWIERAKLRKTIDKQRMPDDMRVRFLTRAQLEQLATAHRRQIATPGETDTASRLGTLESRVSTLEKDYEEDHEERIAALERAMQRAGMPLTGPQKAINKQESPPEG